MLGFLKGKGIIKVRASTEKALSLAATHFISAGEQGLGKGS